MIYTTTKVVADCKSTNGWVYTLDELTAFIAQCEKAGLKRDSRAVQVNPYGQLEVVVPRYDSLVSGLSSHDPAG